MYVPNSKWPTISLINASRMSNRRMLHTLRLRLTDISAVPAIVSEIREVLLAHKALDPRQHRLVFFRSVGEYSVDIWLSCFTRSVFLTDFLQAQQEILYTIDTILDAHGARFASSLAREALLAGSLAELGDTQLASPGVPARREAHDAPGLEGRGAAER